MTSSSMSSSSSSSIASSPPSSPSKRIHQNSIRLHTAPDAIDPTSLVGKTLVAVRRSPTHPNVILHFSDKSSFQIKVDGYSPQYPGITKEIELSQRCSEVFPIKGGYCDMELTVDHCTCTSMLDKAFDGRGSKESNWEQGHLGIAFKFKQREGWHCIWAMLAESDEEGRCIFRNFEDVYLARAMPRTQNRK